MQPLKHSPKQVFDNPTEMQAFKYTVQDRYLLTCRKSQR